MGAINIDNSGSGSSVTLKSDGTSLLLNGTAVGGSSATKVISNKTAAYTVVSGDLGKIINCTSGTFTVSLTAAATLGAGFTCTIWNTSNTSTDAITIDPNLNETIDAKSVLVLRIGEGTDIVCDGTNWQISYKKTMRGYTENYDKNGDRPVASGDGATAIGYQTTASAVRGVAIGANSAGIGSSAISGAGSMALGGSYASGADSFAAADGSSTSSYGATGANSVAIGKTARATGTRSFSFGHSSTANNSDAYAIGYSATASGDTSLALGVSSTASGVVSLAIGPNTTASSTRSVAIGSNSASQGSQAVSGAGAMALGGSYASGTDSFAAAIGNNTSSYGANNSGNIALGTQCKSSGAFNAVAMGGYSIASGGASIAMGYINQATGDYACAIGGGSNLASGQYSVALGRYAIAAQIGKYSFASGSIANAGDAQYGLMVLRAATTTTTAVALTSDGATATTTNQLIVATNQAMTFFGTLIAKQSASANMASYMIKGAIVNNAGTVSISTVSVEKLIDTIGLTTEPTYTADNTNKGLAITSGAKLTTNIRWVCNLDSVEVTYA